MYEADGVSFPPGMEFAGIAISLGFVAHLLNFRSNSSRE
jgi:hypothetical protein